MGIAARNTTIAVLLPQQPGLLRVVRCVIALYFGIFSCICHIFTPKSQIGAIISRGKVNVTIEKDPIPDGRYPKEKSIKWRTKKSRSKNVQYPTYNDECSASFYHKKTVRSLLLGPRDEKKIP